MLVYLLSYESKDWLRVLDMLKYVFFWLEDKKVWFVCVVVNQNEIGNFGKCGILFFFVELEIENKLVFMFYFSWNFFFLVLYVEMILILWGCCYNMLLGVYFVRFIWNVYVYVLD